MDFERTIAAEQRPVRALRALVEVGHLGSLDLDGRTTARQQVVVAWCLLSKFIKGHRIEVRNHGNEVLCDIEQPRHLVEQLGREWRRHLCHPHTQWPRVEDEVHMCVAPLNHDGLGTRGFVDRGPSEIGGHGSVDLRCDHVRALAWIGQHLNARRD